MLNKLEKKLGKGRIREDADLYLYTTLRTRTKAKYFFEANTRSDLINARKKATEEGLEFYLLGGGSNVVFAHNFDGLVVKNLYQQMKVLKNETDYVEFIVASGTPMSRLVGETVSTGYGGMEYQMGLPGTVGGALYMNSKWTNPVSYCGDNLLYAIVIDKDGKEKKVERSYFQFGYDYSKIQETKEIILEAVFRFNKTDPKILKQRAENVLSYRKATQPSGISSSGCFFQNVDGQSAGELIDRVGLKGFKVGNFAISDKHANFILNQGSGQSKDLVKLLKIIKNKVKEKFGIKLEEEVILI